MVCPEGSSYLLRGRIFLYHWQGVQRANGKPPALSVWMFPHGFSRRVRPEGDWGRAESPQCARRRIPPAPVGIDAPTTAREQGWQPYGALTLFFRWRKKSVQKKASGTATPGKSPLLPILTAGLAMSRAAELARLRMLSCALGARLFPPSNWAGLFSSAAYRRSASAQLAVGILTPCKLGCLDVAGRFCVVDEQADFLFPQSVAGILTPCGLGCFDVA